jgi:hypothetical protein
VIVTGEITDDAFAGAVSMQSTCLLLMQEPASSVKSVVQAHAQLAGTDQPFAELNIIVTGEIAEDAFVGALSVQSTCFS